MDALGSDGLGPLADLAGEYLGTSGCVKPMDLGLALVLAWLIPVK